MLWICWEDTRKRVDATVRQQEKSMGSQWDGKGTLRKLNKCLCQNGMLLPFKTKGLERGVKRDAPMRSHHTLQAGEPCQKCKVPTSDFF